MSSILNIALSAGPILAIIGTYLLILSHNKNHEIEHTIEKGLSTEGTVVEIRSDKRHSTESNVQEVYAPVVEFTTINGTFRHYAPSFRASCKYEVGQKVKIYYFFYKSRREMALEDDEPGTLPNTLLKWGIIFCAIGYPMLLSKMAGLI